VRELLLIRHAPTGWNVSGRIQGRRDPALSPAGRAALAGCRVPAPWAAGEWCSSPLARARETACLLGASRVHDEPALIEMDWGEWEGETLAALRARLGATMRANESRGLDFRPAGGESPREVRDRLRAWLADLAPEGPAVIAVTHKGVIATGWDMREDFRVRIDWRCGHAMRAAPGGALAIVRLNVALTAQPA
jgi:broad specificity phosphatase PhoE